MLLNFVDDKAGCHDGEASEDAHRHQNVDQVTNAEGRPRNGLLRYDMVGGDVQQ